MRVNKFCESLLLYKITQKSADLQEMMWLNKYARRRLQRSAVRTQHLKKTTSHPANGCHRRSLCLRSFTHEKSRKHIAMEM